MTLAEALQRLGYTTGIVGKWHLGDNHPPRPLAVTSGDDGAVILWSSATFELTQSWNAGTAVRGIAFSPNGQRVVAGDRQGTLHVYDIDSGEEVANQTHAGSMLDGCLCTNLTDSINALRADAA